MEIPHLFYSSRYQFHLIARGERVGLIVGPSESSIDFSLSIYLTGMRQFFVTILTVIAHEQFNSLLQT